MIINKLLLIRIPVFALLSVILTAFILRNGSELNHSGTGAGEFNDSLHFALKNKLKVIPRTQGWQKLFEEAVKIRQQNKYESAWSRFREAMKYSPDYPGFYEEAIVTVNSYTKADEFRSIAQSYVKSPFYMNYAMSLLEQKFGDLQKALEYAAGAVKLQSGSSEIVYSSVL